MTNIALICEGISENKMISHLLLRYMGEDCCVNAIQPEITNSGRGAVQASSGGWSEVLHHCNDEVIKNALSFNDYVVIQIDTDACYQKEYGVNPLDENGRRKSDECLYKDVCERLCRDISIEWQKKLIFAICFDETECWLLPLYYQDKKRCATHNCIFTLNKKLASKGMQCIPDKDKNSTNAIAAYNKILKDIKRKKDVELISKYNWGFSKFIEQLKNIEG